MSGVSRSQPMSAEEETAILQARGDLAVQNRNYWQEEAERRADQIAALVKALEEIAEFCSGDGRNLGAVLRLAEVQSIANKALSHQSAKT